MNQSTHCGRFEPCHNRRQFLARAGAGFGSVALAHLLRTYRQPLATKYHATLPLLPLPS